MNSNFFNLLNKSKFFFVAIALLFLGNTSLQAQCPEASAIQVTTTDVTCNGFGDGTITIDLTDANGYSGNINYALLRNPAAGLPPIIISTTTSDLSVTFTGLLSAVYTVILTPEDPTCPPIVASDLAVINEPPVLTATLDNVLPACTPGTGSIDITVAGGNGGYNYVWSGPTDPGNVEDATNLDAGTYSVTVTDSKGCTVEILDIFVPVITTADAGEDQIVCENFTTLDGNAYQVPGEIGTWLVISGSGTFTDPNNPTTDVTALGVGTNVFEWFITDENGICAGTRDQVSITWNDLQLSSPGDFILNCNGVADGTGSFVVSGGGAPFAFTVDQNTTGAVTSTTATSLDFTDAGPGVLEVTVTDTDGCSQTQLINISEPPAVVIDATASTDVTCFGGADGTITITASGGTGALSYTLLPNGVVNNTGGFTGLSAGDYTVEVTDANGCGPVTTSTITILDGATITIDNVASTDPSCAGDADGTVTVTASGGVAPLTYTLQPANISNNTGTFTGLAAGSYTVDVNDAGGCGPISTGAITLTDPPLPTVDNIVATPISCFGANDGSIALTVSGGVGPLTYTITPGGDSNNTGTFTNLAPGNYTIEIQEANGCPPITTSAITITEPTEITISGTAFTDPNCFGVADGTVTVTAAGGTGALSYTLQPAGITNATGVFAAVAAGTYTVDVTDANGCGPVTSTPITLTDPAEIVIDATTSTDVSCTAGNDGSLEVTASGGTGALTYTLQPGGVSNATGLFTTLTAGDYTVEITDANGCGPVVTSTITIADGSDITIDDVQFTDVTCIGDTDGTITVAASGTGPLSYTIQPLNVTNTTGVFTGLAVGDYTVEVDNPAGCGPAVTGTITISDPIPPSIDDIAVTQITCFGADDGAIALTVSGGTTPLTYTITPGGASNTTGTFTGLAPGSYTIEIQEASGCPPISTGSIDITSPAEIVISSTTFTDPTCFGAADGTVTAVAAGGTGALSYTLQPAGITNATGVFTGVAAGTYTVDVTDANNCGPVTSSPVTVTEPAEIVIDTVTPVDVTCTGGTDGSITVVASGGTGALTYTLQPGAVANATGVFANLGVGTYTVEVTDANGCGPVVTAAIEINEPVLNLPVTDAGSCSPAQTDVVITVGGTTAGITYELQTTAGASLTPPVTAVSAGGDLDLVILQANAPTVTTTYQVVAQIPGCGNLVNTNQPTVNVSPVPDVTLAVSDATACSTDASDAVFIISGSENGVTYELLDLGGNSLTPPVTVTGNGGDASLILPSAQLPGATETYQVAADNGVGCSAILDDQPTLNVTPGPTASFQGDLTICKGETADLLVDLTGTGPWDVTYTDGANTFTVNAAASPAVISVNPSATQTYDLVSVTDNGTGCINAAPASSATVTVDPVAGDEITFGMGEWIGYVYNDGPTGAPYPDRVDFDPSKYRGFINQPENFDLDLNNSIPLTGPDLCGSYLDNYSIRFKLRKDFPAGSYQITVGGDDGYRLSLDGGVTFLIDEFQDQVYTTSTINLCLDGTVDLVVEYYENSGLSRVSFDATLLSPSLPVDVTIAADQLPACVGSATTFTATAINAGANPTYQWQVNGTDVPGEVNPTFTSSTLNSGDIVRAIVTASAAVICPTNNPAISNELTYSAVTELTADVTVTPDQDPACVGTPITFTANPINGGGLPTFQWQLNGVDIPGEVNTTFVSSTLNDGDLISVVMNADPALTCVLNPVVISAQVPVSIVTDLTATATITSSANPACIGEDVTFTSVVTDAGANPTFQWQVNGTDVAGETSDTYVSNALADGDIVTLVVTADPLATCVNNSPVTSNQIIQLVQSGVPMTVDIAADQTDICAGDPVTFTTTVTDAGANPTYQWQLNGIDVPGEVADSFVSSTLVDGDMVNVVVTADPAAGCVTNSPLASAAITIMVQSPVTATATITADQNPVCVGDIATFTVSITDGGANPTIQWQVNGTDAAGETNTTFTSAGLTEGDVVRAVVTVDPAAGCATTPVVNSNEISLSIVTDLTASVTVAPDQDPVCIGDAVTFTATAANAGANPTYQWQVNGIDVTGETAQTFTSSALSNGDAISVVLSADPAATCVNNPVVISAPYSINVVTSLNPAATIVADQTTICAGSIVTFTATATEAGLNPSYQWQINGVPVTGANDAVFATNALANGDQVNVLVTPDPAASCAPAGAVSSNVLDIFVRPANDPICAGGIGCGAFVVEVIPVRPPCNQPDAGSLTFLVSGGSGSYTLILTDNNGFNQGEIGIANTPILFEDLTAADYEYTITDTNGNTCTLPFTLQNETIIEAAVVDITNSACFNEPDGSATIEILSGGNAPYEYSLDGILWNQALTSVFTVDNLSAANSPIGILIRDNASDVCPEEVFVTIDNLYPEIQANITTTPVETCDGTEGSITVTFPPVGGNSPSNTWEIGLALGTAPPAGFEPFTADRTFSDLAASNYTVYIRDEGGCEKPLPVVVEAPDQVNLIAIATGADCSNDGRSGSLQIQVANTLEVPGPYRLTIEALDGSQAGQIIYQDAAYGGEFIAFDTLISATYQVEVMPNDPDLCSTQVEVTISGGPQPVFFDYELSCGAGTNLKQLLLTNIQGNEGTSYTLRVFDNLTSALVEEIPFVLNIGDQFLIENYFFLTVNQEYRLRLVQSPDICSGADIAYDHPETLLIPAQLVARVGETTKSLPDRATGTMQILDFVGGFQPRDNAFPYLVAIELDSAAVPGQSFTTDFDTVRLNQNLEFEQIYEDIPAGRYRVIVMDHLGCSIELVARVPLDTDIFIPNIFTPNGDGSNETFFIRNKPDEPVKLLISNRWGKRVYFTDDYQNEWDGDDLPDGIYFYSIKTDDQEYSGWVEIMR